jgi:hydroxymethylpyrimidine/phosphomethylpyrimidine kinase
VFKGGETAVTNPKNSGYRGIALTAAGSDSGGGAGIQADLKTFAALRVFGTSVITAVTAQNSLGVRHVEVLSPESIKEQLRAVLSDFPVGAMKTGMLASSEVIEALCEVLSEFAPQKIVVDPVMISQTGHALIDQSAISTLKEKLFKHAMLVTPNLPEAEKLVGFPIEDKESAQKAASAIAQMGAKAVLIKGGHRESQTLQDLLFIGERVRVFTHPRIPTENTHGTGCTLSAAITAELASGCPLEEAVERGITYLQMALRRSFRPGKGPGPVGHFVVPSWVGEADD